MAYQNQLNKIIEFYLYRTKYKPTYKYSTKYTLNIRYIISYLTKAILPFVSSCNLLELCCVYKYYNNFLNYNAKGFINHICEVKHNIFIMFS